MPDIDLKTSTPDGSLPTTGFLFGADSQSASSPSVYTTQSVATTLLGSTTLSGTTITANAPVLDLAQTWNNAAVAFTGLRFNAATGSSAGSASASLLLDLQLEGVSRFNVSKTGTILVPASGGISAPSNLIIRTTSNSGILIYGSDLNNEFFTLATQGNGTFTCRSSGIIGWTSGSFANASPDILLTRRGAANLRLGAADAATALAQTLSVQSVVAGTTNGAGANFTITGSQGTGSGAGGSIIFQVAPAGGSGTGQNTLVNALTINSARQMIAETSSDAAPAFTFSGATGTGLSARGAVGRLVSGSVGAAEYTSAGEFRLGGAGYLSWAANTSVDPGAASDVRLFRDAANTLALRNGTNAQTFNVYNTFTDASNYERATLGWTSNVFRISTGNAGTGSTRGIQIFSAGGSIDIVDGSSVCQINFNTQSSTGIRVAATRPIGFTPGDANAASPDVTLRRVAAGILGIRSGTLNDPGALSFIEQTAPSAPATNGVYIYAEDNGSGKTRLMALFATGAAQQIAIEP